MTSTADGSREKRLIVGWASAAFVGIALSVVDVEFLGGLVTVVSIVALAWSLHRFGRTGPDQPLRY